MCPLYRFILPKNIIRSVSSSDSHLCEDYSVLCVGFLSQEVFYLLEENQRNHKKLQKKSWICSDRTYGQEFSFKAGFGGAKRILFLLIFLLLFLHERRIWMKGCDSINSDCRWWGKRESGLTQHFKKIRKKVKGCK